MYVHEFYLVYANNFIVVKLFLIWGPPVYCIPFYLWMISNLKKKKKTISKRYVYNKTRPRHNIRCTEAARGFTDFGAGDFDIQKAVVPA